MGIKEHGSNPANRQTVETSGFFSQGKRLPHEKISREPVVFSPSAQRRIQRAKEAGVDPLFLKGLTYSLQQTAPKEGDGPRVVTTDQTFQFGLLTAEMKGKPVHPGELHIQPKKIK